MNELRVFKWVTSLTVALVIGSYGMPVSAQFTANSLAELRSFSNLSNATVTLAPGDYWIDGDHIANPTSSEPIFLDLSGTNNTYNLTGANIKLDTRKFDGFGRALGHGSSVRVVQISGSDNTVNDLSLTGYDVDVVTDPNAQRHADWAAVYVKLTGDTNTVNGADVLTRGSSPYGLGDVFGKGARQFPQGSPPGQVPGEPDGVVGLPWIGHNKTSAFQVIASENAVVNDMHLDVRTYGHGFFVQDEANNTTLTNSTVTGQLFSSNDVIATAKYQEYGITSHGNELPADMMISGAEDGVRMYTGSTGLTVDNVVVIGMRTGFSVALGRGTMTLNDVEAYNTENAFNFKSNTTITNAKGNITHGPLLHTPYDSASNTSVDIELVGGVPEGVDWGVGYVAGSNLDITVDSALAAGALPDDSMIRLGQVFFDNWRDSKNPTGPEDHGDKLYDYINSTFVNNTSQMVVLGENVTGNTGSSLGQVITNGKDNDYDGVSLVPTGKRTVLVHVDGLGNNGTASDGSLESNASIVKDGGTLELNPGIQITDEKLTITGDGVDGNGALYSDGQTGSGTRFGSSSNGNESTIFLDGDASIGVGIAGNQLLVGRIQGTGNLTKRGAGKLSIEKSSTYVGDLTVAEGQIIARSEMVHNNLTIASGASMGAIGGNMLSTPDGAALVDGTLDLNSRTDSTNVNGTIGLLNGSGQVTSSNPTTGFGSTLTLAGNDADGHYTGEIDGNVTLVKSGDNNQTLAGIMTHTGTTTVSGGGLYIDGAHTGGGDYTVNAGTLGGVGSIESNVTVNNGATLAAGGVGSGDTGLLTLLGLYSQATESTLAFDILNGSTYDRLNVGGTASLAGTLELTSTDPTQYNIGDVLALLYAGGGLSGQFAAIDGVSVGSVNGLAAGLAVLYTPQNVTAFVSIMGDANLDNQVDILSDAALLVQNLGMTTGATWTDGDFNGDGAVDILGDAALLVSNLGAELGGSSANTSAVPEPTSALVLIALALPCMVQRRRR